MFLALTLTLTTAHDNVQVVMSTHNAEITEEVHSAKYLRGALTSLAYSPTLDRAAMCGGNQVP